MDEYETIEVQQAQTMLVIELCYNVRDSVLEQIKAGKVPKSWDGHELRQLLADRFAASAGTMRPGSKKRKEYENTKLVNNL